MPGESLRESDVIKQATGMLAERLDVTVDEAYAFMRSAARSQGLELDRLAEEVVYAPKAMARVLLRVLTTQ
ncbi:MAG: ANTAR domain-containing protein [Actinomycetota bacterium]